MDAKTALTNGVFCPIPWTGLMYNFDGSVKNCIRSAGKLGNIKDQPVEKILVGDVNLENQANMLNDRPARDCHTCYDLEHGKKKFDIISDRVFYIRELKAVPFDTYRLGNHDLKTVDVRWSNICNFSCVYCSPEFSSRWADELKIQTSKPGAEQVQAFKSFILDRAKDLKHVYLAGGEPLLMKENLELLTVLQKQNPNVNLRVNTNLSKVDTKVFETVCQFQNVHWTISVESMESEFEYIRTGGNWQDFLDNLGIVRKLGHKISFNMLYFLLNHDSWFDCVAFLQKQGFHNNSFVTGPLLTPLYLNVRHLPDHVLQSLKERLENQINQRPGYLLEDSLRNLLHYIQQPFVKNLKNSFDQLRILDQRRNQDSSKIFTNLYKLA